jgi:hypothetical protein
LIWLTCPRISKIIDKLEADKLKFYKSIIKKESISESNDNFKEWFLNSNLLTKEQYEIYKNKNQFFGNSGIRIKDTIKCLHSHVACTLSNIDDKVGEHTINDALSDLKEDSLNCKDCKVECRNFSLD